MRVYSECILMRFVDKANGVRCVRRYATSVWVGLKLILGDTVENHLQMLHTSSSVVRLAFERHVLKVGPLLKLPSEAVLRNSLVRLSLSLQFSFLFHSFNLRFMADPKS